MRAGPPRGGRGRWLGWPLALLLALALLNAWPPWDGPAGQALAAPAKAKDKPAPKPEAKPEAKPGESLPGKSEAKPGDKIGVISGDKAEESVTGFDPKAPEGDAASPPTYDPRLIQLIEQKRADLAAEEARLARERQELTKLKDEVVARIDELKKVQGALEELVKTDQEQRENRVQQLVKVLSNMKADAAGAVVAKLDDQMAVDVFSKMAPRTSGKVMASLKPDQAARISELLTRTQQSREAAKLAGAAAAAGTPSPAPARPAPAQARPPAAAPAPPPQSQAAPPASDQKATLSAGAKPGATPPASTEAPPAVVPVPTAPLAPLAPTAPAAAPAAPAAPAQPARR